MAERLTEQVEGFESPSAQGDASEGSRLSNPWQTERLHKLADLSPRGAILESWLLFEEGVHAIDSRLNPSSYLDRNQSVHRILDRWTKQGWIPASLVSVIDDLRDIRNEAVHEADEDLSVDFTQGFINITQKVFDTLNALHHLEE